MSQTYFLFTIYDTTFTSHSGIILVQIETSESPFSCYIFIKVLKNAFVILYINVYIMHFMELHFRYELYTSIVPSLLHHLCLIFFQIGVRHDH